MRALINFVGSDLPDLALFNCTCLEVILHGVKLHYPAFNMLDHDIAIDGEVLDSIPNTLPEEINLSFVPSVSGDFWATVGTVLAVTSAVFGVTSALRSAHVNKQNEKTEKGDAQSYLFAGVANTSAQGNILPLMYGRALVGSTTIYTAFEGSGQAIDQLFKIQDVVSDGEIVGLVTRDNLLQSVYFDDTPASNFEGSAVIERRGTDPQDVVEGYNDVRATESVGIVVDPDGGTVIQQISAGYYGVDVSIRFPQGIYRIKQSGLSSGEIVSHHALTNIEVSPANAGTWTPADSFYIETKTMNETTYTRHIVNPFSGAAFDIRLVNPDPSEESHRVRERLWFSNTLLTEGTYTYPNTAYYSTQATARSVGEVPTRGFDIQGKIVQVPGGAAGYYIPATFDTTTGEKLTNASYDGGVWDGTFTLLWTDDPVWVAYDLITNSRYGLGSVIGALNIDIFDLYEASLYNTGLVEDPRGVGGMNNRYLFNYQLTTQQNGFAQLEDILKGSQASLYQSGALLKLFQDRPTTPTTLVNQTLIIGDVAYSSNQLDGKYTELEVVFNDESDRYLPKTIRQYASAETIAKYGSRRLQVSDTGCTNEAQAIRSARWALENAHTEGIVNATFQVGYYHSELLPGAVIYLADDFAQPENTSGRIKEITAGPGQVFMLDRPHTLTGPSTVRFNGRDGVMYVRDVVPGATTLELENVGPEITPGVVSLPFVIEVSPVTLWRVLGVAQTSPGIYDITTARHDPDKYARIETGVDTPPDVIPPPDFDIPAPENGRGIPQARVGDGGIVIGYNLNLSWDECKGPDDLPHPDIIGYTVEYDGPSGKGIVQVDTTNTIIQWAEFGEYNVRVTGRTQSASRNSAALTYIYDFQIAGDSNLVPPAITGEFIHKDCYLQWTDNPANDALPEIPKRYKISVRNASAVIHTAWVVVGDYDDPANKLYTWQYNYDLNTQQNGGVPVRELWLDVQTEDEFTLLSAPDTVNPSNAAPAVIAQNVSPGFDAIFIDLTPSTEPDVAGYVIEYSVAGSGGPYTQIDLGGATFWNGPAQGGQEYYIRSAAYDLFGKTGLSYNAAVPATPLPPDFTASFSAFSFVNLTISPQMDAAGNPTGVLHWGIISFPSDVPIAGWAAIKTVDDIPTRKENGPAGSVAFSGSPLYVYYDWTTHTIIATASWDFPRADTWLLGVYHGGTTWKVASGAEIITGDTIAANSITATNIAAGTIGADEINANDIYALNITAGQINATDIDACTITASTITADQIIGDLVSAQAKNWEETIVQNPNDGTKVTEIIAEWTVTNNTAGDASIVFPLIVAEATMASGPNGVVKFLLELLLDDVVIYDTDVTAVGTPTIDQLMFFSSGNAIPAADTAAHTYKLAASIDRYDGTIGGVNPALRFYQGPGTAQIFRDGGAFAPPVAAGQAAIDAWYIELAIANPAVVNDTQASNDSVTCTVI